MAILWFWSCNNWSRLTIGGINRSVLLVIDSRISFLLVGSNRSDRDRIVKTELVKVVVGDSCMGDSNKLISGADWSSG
jgi:hypothetical protein